jgi:hypothetical protein
VATPEEFEAAARAFERAADELIALLAPVTSVAGMALFGGALTFDVELALDGAEHAVVDLVRDARASSRRCREGADEARRHAAQLLAEERALASHRLDALGRLGADPMEIGSASLAAAAPPPATTTVPPGPGGLRQEVR